MRRRSSGAGVPNNGKSVATSGVRAVSVAGDVEDAVTGGASMIGSAVSTCADILMSLGSVI